MQPSLPQVLLATQLLSSTSMHSSPSRSPLWTKPRKQVSARQLGLGHRHPWWQLRWNTAKALWRQLALSSSRQSTLPRLSWPVPDLCPVQV